MNRPKPDKSVKEFRGWVTVSFKYDPTRKMTDTITEAINRAKAAGYELEASSEPEALNGFNGFTSFGSRRGADDKITFKIKR